MNNYIFNNSFNKQYKKRKYKIEWNIKAYLNICDHVKNFHVHASSIRVSTRVPTKVHNHVYMAENTLYEVFFPCEIVYKSVEQFELIMSNRKEFVKFIEPIIMENSL